MRRVPYLLGVFSTFTWMQMLSSAITWMLSFIITVAQDLLEFMEPKHKNTKLSASSQSVGRPRKERAAVMPMMVGLRLQNKSVLIVGAGDSLTARVQAVSMAGATPTIICPRVSLVEAMECSTHIDKDFEISDLHGHNVVIVLDPLDRAQMVELVTSAKRQGILVHAAGAPELSDFSFIATASRGPVQIAVCVDGKAPMLAKRLCSILEAALPQGVDQAVEKVGGHVALRASERAHT